MTNQPVEGAVRIKDGVNQYFHQGEWLTCDLRTPYEIGRADMLEEVIKYLENHLEFVLWVWSDEFLEQFKKAMRPQEDNQ